MNHTKQQVIRQGCCWALAAVVLVGATGCGADPEPQASAPGETSSPAGTTTSPSPTESTESPAETSSSEPGTYETKLAGYDVRVRLAAPDRFRLDGVTMPRLHFLPVNVATDPEAERWGDMFMWAPTKIYDPKTQKRRPLPVDPVSWLEDNPGVEVLRKQQVEIGGQPAWQLDVKRDGSELFGDAAGGLEGDGYERMVLWQVGDSWFLGQASTFLGEKGLLAPDGKNDPFMSLLDGATFEKA